MNNDFITVTPGNEKNSPRAVDIFIPEKITRKRALLFIHGGGWYGGCREDFRDLCRAFRERGFVCATAEYRRQNHPSGFEQLSDIRLGYERFVQELRARGITPRIAVWGTSAGAHLASLLLCAEPGECGEEVLLSEPWLKPEAGMLQSTPVYFGGWDDINDQIWRGMQVVAGKPYAEAPELYERLSLINYIRPDNPKLFFMEAADEELFPSEFVRPLAEKHWQWGIDSWYKVYHQAEHGFFFSLDRLCQQQAFEDMILFMESSL